jgi:hypothetical protein
MRHCLIAVVCCGLFLLPRAAEAKTTVLFEPSSADVGPFPTNVLTKADPKQKTGLRVNLDEAPSCLGSDFISCPFVKELLNQLDGFSVKPQIRVCFSGPIDIATVQRSVRIVPSDGDGRPVGINQVFYDPFFYDAAHGRSIFCVHAKPEHVLDQSTRYLLIVTNRLQDASGSPVARDEAFKTCLKGQVSGYCAELIRAIRRSEVQETNVVGASLFTTMSATDWMEKARRFLYASPVLPTTVPAGPKTVFNLSDLQSFEWLPQTNITEPPSSSLPLPLQAFDGVKRVAFGLYLSPNFLRTSGPEAGSIEVTPTARPIQQPVPVDDPSLAIFPPGYIPISYHVFLPQVTPGAKIPVVIYGHGSGDSQFGAPTAIASTLAKAGFATLAMEEVGHGFGPGSLASLTDSTGQYFVSTPGRGIPLAPDGSIQPGDGCFLPGPIAVRDCLRQTAVDVMALVQNINANGLGVNLDPSRIYYVGQSLGSFIGSLVHAVEPRVKAAVLNVGGDSVLDTARLSFGDFLADFYLFSYNPVLAAVVGEAPFLDPAFDYSFPYRDQLTESPGPGVGDIQRVFEVADWLNIPGAPLAFAPHFRVQPLPGVPAKRTLFQFGFGDLEVPNPTQSALVRAAVGRNHDPDAPLPVSYWRFDLAVAANPHLAHIFMEGASTSILPHRILANPSLLDPANGDELVIALGMQRQVADFFASRPITVTPPFFEIPTLSTLPEIRNFTWPFEFAPAP